MLHRFVCGSLPLLLAALLTAQHPNLLTARKGFDTKLLVEKRSKGKLSPAGGPFDIVAYPTKLGPMTAYLSRPAERAKRYPAIIWITGGDTPGGAGKSIWQSPDPDDDQTAQAFQRAGMITMYPAFRGSFGNPGFREAYYGEVDDTLAALAYLKTRDFVDPKRIYLGGHSSGGTLALLVAAASDEFKAVFAFGPVGNPVDYGNKLPFDMKNRDEVRLRAPIAHLRAIRTPTFAIEGADGNYAALIKLKVARSSKQFKVIGVSRADHFDVLYPTNRWIAAAIHALPAEQPVKLNRRAIQTAFDAHLIALRESDDLDVLAIARREGVDFSTPQRVTFELTADDKSDLDNLAIAAKANRFDIGKIQRTSTSQWNTNSAFDSANGYLLPVHKKLILGDLSRVFATSKSIDALCRKHSAEFEWSIATPR